MGNYVASICVNGAAQEVGRFNSTLAAIFFLKKECGAYEGFVYDAHSGEIYYEGGEA